MRILILLAVAVKPLLVVVLVIMTFSTTCFAVDSTQTELVIVNEFRGMVWGTPVEKLKAEKKMVLSAPPGKTGRSLYNINNDKLSIGAATLDSLFYLFYDNKFSGVVIATKGRENYTNLVHASSEKYKNCLPENKYSENYQCYVKGASILLKYNQFSEQGSLIIFSGENQKERNSKLAESAKIGAKNDF